MVLLSFVSTRHNPAVAMTQATQNVVADFMQRFPDACFLQDPLASTF